jgi:hypothetical protein
MLGPSVCSHTEAPTAGPSISGALSVLMGNIGYSRTSPMTNRVIASSKHREQRPERHQDDTRHRAS